MTAAHRTPTAGGSLLTLADVAGRLRCHPKTLLRALPELCAREPQLQLRKIGRSLCFNEADYQTLLEAMAWRPADLPMGVRFGKQPTAQDRARERATAMLAAKEQARRK